MKIMRKIIEIDEELCDGCGNCVTACDEGAIQIVNGKAKVVNDVFCDGLGACIGDCPLDALKIVEREAEAFDEEAVKEHLATLNPNQENPGETLACGCPSSNIQTFIPVGSCQAANQPKKLEKIEVNGPAGRVVSALSNWPIQINLVPSQAPFLKGADVVLAADCVTAAYPNFHQDFLKDKVLLMGCPKLDDGEEYVRKFADMFATAGIRSLTVLIMEVPCCSGMPMIVKKAMALSGATFPVEEVIISIREGKVLQRIRN